VSLREASERDARLLAALAAAKRWHSMPLMGEPDCAAYFANGHPVGTDVARLEAACGVVSAREADSSARL